MKYLIAVPSLSAGSGLSRYVFTLCRFLADSEEIVVLTTHNSQDTSYEWQELDKCGKNIRLISLGRYGKLLKYLKAVRVVRNFSPDILINNYNGLIQMILPLIPRKTKVIHVLHNDAPDFYRVGALNGNRINGWIAPTKAIAEHFNQYTANCFAKSISVIPHGVEISDYRPGNCSDRIELLYAGVLSTHKGVQYLAPITKELRRRGYNFRLTIIGSGFLEEDTKAEFTDEISRGEVRMTGVISHEKVYELMSESDIFLYPTNCDAFGLVIAEAMMNGMAPVVGHLEGITDNLIDDSENGFLVSPHDVEGYIAIVDRLMSDSRLLSEIRKRARSKALEFFSESTMARNYRSYFANISNSNIDS